MRISVALLFGALVVSPLLLTAGCSSDEDPPAGEPSVDAGGDRRRPDPIRPDASCPVLIEAPEILDSPHVPEGTQVTYNSNPPSSGPHYPAWANFQEFDKPVDRGYLVHSLEHGAVVLLYKCASPTDEGCAPLVEGLRRVRAAAAEDRACDPSVHARVIIAPDPAIDTPIAGAAWGFTYKGDCLDEPTLSMFVRDYYAGGPEDFCTPGRTF